jgi:predicted outer membrane repeat protein
MLLASASTATAGTTCDVLNVGTQAHFGSLQAAVSAATAGDRLKVTGVCIGSTVVDRRLIIRGAPSGSGQAVLDGDHAGRVLEIASGVTVRLEALVVRNGRLTQDFGGGILNHGKLTATDVTVMRNRAFSGGGIYSTGELALDGTTTVKRNQLVIGDGDGGGVYIDGGSLTMAGSSSVHHNAARRGGGGVYGVTASMTLEDTASVHHNESTTGGGGIYADFDSTLVLGGSSSVHDNLAGEHGGGVFDNSSVTITGASTIEDNTATQRGGGVYVGCGAILTGSHPGSNVQGNHRTNVARETGCG